MATLNYENGKFIFRGSFDEREIPKSARFRWDSVSKLWWTDDKSKAATLIKYASATTRAILVEEHNKMVEVLKASRATDADVDLPRPEGLEYLPYQKAGIVYASERAGTLIADEMGLGKTIQAIGVANLTQARKILVICPATLRINWQREFEKWSIANLKCGVAIANDYPEDCDIVIINYDIVDRHRDKIDAVEWDLLICDEAHYLKNQKTQRTVAVLGGKLNKKKAKS